MPNNIRYFREAEGITQEELAKRAGISRPFLSNIETGSAIPTIKIALRISESLHKTLDELFSENQK